MTDQTLNLAMVPIALRKEQAARVLGMSTDSFERYVMREIRCVRVGNGSRSLKLYPVEELQRWVRDRSAHVLDG